MHTYNKRLQKPLFQTTITLLSEWTTPYPGQISTQHSQEDNLLPPKAPFALTVEMYSFQLKFYGTRLFKDQGNCLTEFE